MYSDDKNPHIKESRILASVRPRMQAAGWQCLKLQIAVASPDPQTRTFPGTELSRKIRSPNLCTECMLVSVYYIVLYYTIILWYGVF